MTALRPMRAASYLGAARQLRRFADALEARADATTPRERAALTLTVHTMVHFVRVFAARHARRPLYPPLKEE